MTRRYAAAAALTAVLLAAMATTAGAAVVSRADLAVLRTLARMRTAAATDVMRAVAAVGSPWTVRGIVAATLIVLIAARRFQHLATYMIVGATVSFAALALSVGLGRMRPAGVTILDGWSGYSDPAVPVVALCVALAGVVYTTLPAGRWRTGGRWVCGTVIVAVVTARLYLAVDHPSDVLAAVVIGWALPVAVYRVTTPDDVFPVVYRGGRRAHLDLSGARGAAIVRALDHQLGLDVVAVEPFGQEGSAGSTPLRLRVRRPEGGETLVFGKLYALNHLRSDRWYKLTRTVLYGRLEDEKPFSSVRRLVEYEDHLLRLLRDAGLPTPQPYGFVEITPEREYLIVMELFDGAREIGDVRLSEGEIDQGLAIVRQLCDSGVAHRDIKPSNVLVGDGRVYLIDVAFGTVRPTPWRQAVDLANMMLTLALSSSPELVYGRALRVFSPDDLAEAFAANRGVTIPTQLRVRLRADGRDLVARFRELAPDRPPVPIQLWSVRRVGIALLTLAAAVLAVTILVAYSRTAGLL